MAIQFFSEDIDFPNIDRTEIKKWVSKVIASKQVRTGKINYIFVSDAKILEVNRQYLQHDYYTDVITFDYCEDNKISGDIFISLDTVKTNAQKYEQEYYTELKRVIIHGVLHLLGYKDKTQEEAKTMRIQENIALELLND